MYLAPSSRVEKSIAKPLRDPLLELVSLQKASGCWMLDAALATALGKPSKELKKKKPSAVSLCHDRRIDANKHTTI